MTLESKKIIKKLNELEEKISRITGTHHAYIMALLTILREEGVLKEGRFEELAGKYKKLLRDADDHAEFIRMMRQIGKQK